MTDEGNYGAKTATSKFSKLTQKYDQEERHLWYDFLKTYPIQFKRQYPIGNYIVDFYCFRAKLILELDGNQHCQSSAVAYDRHRTAYLHDQGFEVVRISNRDVTERFREVCETIDATVRARLSG